MSFSGIYRWRVSFCYYSRPSSGFAFSMPGSHREWSAAGESGRADPTITERPEWQLWVIRVGSEFESVGSGL